MGCAEAPDYDNDGGRINSLDVSTLPHPYLALTGPLPHPYLTQSTVCVCVCMCACVCYSPLTRHPLPLTAKDAAADTYNKLPTGCREAPRRSPREKFPEAILGATMTTMEASEDSLWDAQRLQD